MPAAFVAGIFSGFYPFSSLYFLCLYYTLKKGYIFTKTITAVPYIFEIVILTTLFEPELIVF